METLHSNSSACAFLHELKEFHQNKGSPFLHPPRVNRQIVDLYKLYNQVTSLGGWKKVSAGDLWIKVLKAINFPHDCTNSITAIKEIYIRYLYLYEKIHFHGDDLEDSSESQPNQRSNSGPILLTKPYNYSQHEIPNVTRVQHGLATPYMLSDYEKLCRGLQSGLPNEQDFALNVCTLLSNDSRNVLHLERCPQLVDLLLLQAGVWPEEDITGTTRSTYLECWQGIEGRNVERFWVDTVHDPEVLSLWPPHHAYKFKVTEDDLELFNLGQQLGASNSEQQRILRVALILHNLSFERHNVQVLVKNNNLLRFLLLCCHCKWAYLRQVALDTLGNLAPQLILTDEPSHGVLLRTIINELGSSDRLGVARALEVLARLSRQPDNKEILLATLPPPTFHQLILLLTVCDVMLLLFVLEALYALTDLGRSICDRILSVHRCIEILVNLLTLESHSYGTPAQAGIRLVEVLEPSDQPLPHIRPTNHHPPPSRSPSVCATPPPPSTSPLSNPPTPTREPDGFTCNWLLKNYEMAPGYHIPRNDLYSDYINFCSKVGRKSIVNSSHFLHCVKTVFPHSGVRRVETSQGTISFHHESLRRRHIPNSLHHSSTPPAHSPILKAHLSGSTPPSSPRSTTPNQRTLLTATTPPPRVPSPAPPLAMGPPQVATPPPPPANSSLIKNLLATKLNKKQGSSRRINGLLAAATPVQLEVCAQAEEARNLVGDIPYQEAHIERVQNHAILSPSPDEGVAGLDGSATDSKSENGGANVARSDGEQSSSSRDTGFSSEGDVTSPKPACTPEPPPNNKPPNDTAIISPKNSPNKKTSPINGLIDVVSFGVPEPTIPNGVLSDAKSPASTTDSQSSVVGNKLIVADELDSAENSNPSSDLSSISDIARTLECASKAISQSSTNCLEDSCAIKLCSIKRSLVDEDSLSEKRAKLNESLNAKDVNSNRESEISNGLKSTTESSHSASQSPSPQTTLGPQYFCEWKDCLRSFTSSPMVLRHVWEQHIPEDDVALVCEWGQCDGLLRQRLSLLTHLQDRHCSEHVLRGRSSQLLAATAHVSTPPPPVYIPDPAHVAIRKNYLHPRELREEREGPLTKSIRLTSALVLRNLCIHSSLARRFLRRHEHIVSTLASSCSESARTLAQCLFELCQSDC